MTLDEQIKILESNAEFERRDGDLQGCLNFRQLAEWLKDYKRLLEQEPVLDKIRSEIDSHCSDNRDRNDGLYIAMKIIDKYKAEGSEE